VKTVARRLVDRAAQTILPLVEKGQNNLAFATLFQLGDTKSCVDLLVKTRRIPEAAIFARTYAPRYAPFTPDYYPITPTRRCPISYPTFAFSQVPKVVETWRDDLTSKNRPKLAARIASPNEQPDVFEEGWKDILEVERSLRSDGALVDL